MESIIAKSSQRVTDHSSRSVTQEISRRTVENLEAIGSDPQKIATRLSELDREWDIERAIEANASSLILATLVLGATFNKRWFIFSGVVAGFLFQHAIQGWCPPVPVLRRLGFRTPREIENERAILKARRGDFEKIRDTSAGEAMEKMSELH